MANNNKRIVHDPRLLDADSVYQPSLLDELTRIGETVAERMPHVGRQLGAGALELAMSMSPVQHKDGELSLIVPSTIGIPYGLVGMGIDALSDFELPGYKQALETAKHQSEIAEDFTGAVAPQNIGDTLIRNLPEAFLPATLAKTTGTTAQKALKYGLDFLSPYNWTGSRAVAGAEMAIGAGAMEGIDAFTGNEDYTSVVDLVSGATEPEPDTFVPETQPADLYSSVDKALEYDATAQLQQEGDAQALQKELPQKMPTMFIEQDEIGTPLLIDAKPELENMQHESDWSTTELLGGAAIIGLSAFASHSVAKMLKTEAPKDLDGFMGQAASTDVNIAAQRSAWETAFVEAKTALTDRFAIGETLSKVAGFTQRQIDNLEFQQRTRLNPGATQAQLGHMLRTGELPDESGVKWMRLKEAPKKLFDDIGAADEPTRRATRSLLILRNLYNEAAAAGKKMVRTPEANNMPTHMLKYRIQQLEKMPGVRQLEQRFNQIFQGYVPFLHEHGLITTATRNDWMVNRTWYHPMTMDFADAPDLTGNNFINAIIRDLDGDSGSLRSTNQHFLERHNDVLNIGPGEFADPFMTAIKYMENVPRLAFYNTWRRQLVDATLASQDPIAKKIFTKVGKKTKNIKNPRIVSIFRGGKKEDYHVADKRIYDFMLMKPEKFGVVSNVVDNIRQLKQQTITGVFRLGSFIKHSLGFESSIIGITAPRGRYTGALDQVLHAVGSPSISSLSRGMFVDPTMAVPLVNTVSMLPISLARDLYGRSMFRFANTVEFGLRNPNTGLGKLFTAIQQASGGTVDMSAIARQANSAYENSIYHLAQRAGLYHTNMAVNPTMYDNRTLLRDVSRSMYTMYPKQGSMINRMLSSVLDTGSDFLRPLTVMMEAAQSGPRLQYLALNYRKGMRQQDLQRLLYEAKHTLGDTTDAGVNRGSALGMLGQIARVAMPYYRPGVQALTALAEAAARAPTQTAARIATTSAMGLATIGVFSATVPGYWQYFWNTMTPEQRARGFPVPRLRNPELPMTPDNLEFVMSNYDPMLGLAMAPMIEVIGAMGNSVGSDQASFRDMFEHWSLSFTELESQDVMQASSAAFGRAFVMSAPVGMLEGLAMTGNRLNVGDTADPDSVNWFKPIYHQRLDPTKGKTYNSVLPAQFENFITSFAGTVGYATVNSLNQLVFDLTNEHPETGEERGVLESFGEAVRTYAIGASEGSYLFGANQRIHMLDGVGKTVRKKLNVAESLQNELQDLLKHPYAPTADIQRPTYTPELATTLTQTNMPQPLAQKLLNMEGFAREVEALKNKRVDVRTRIDTIYARPELFTNPILMRDTENELVEEFRTINSELYNRISAFEELYLEETTLEDLLDAVRAHKNN